MTVIHAEAAERLYTTMADNTITTEVQDVLGANTVQEQPQRHTIINSVPLKAFVSSNGGGLKILPERTRVLPDGSTKIYSKCLVSGICYVNISASMAKEINADFIRNNAGNLDVVTFDNGYRLLTKADNENIDLF